VTDSPVTFASFSLRDAIDNDRVLQGPICEGDGNEADFHNVVSIDPYPCFGNFVAGPLDAGPQDQGQSLTSPSPSAPQLWKEPDRIEELKELLFDFDTYDSTSEQAVLEADAQWLKDHPNVRVKLAGHTDPRGDIATTLPSPNDVLKQLSRS
jgi:outer membrane protein OmpA-like peptidoglycan-associated protein